MGTDPVSDFIVHAQGGLTEGWYAEGVPAPAPAGPTSASPRITLHSPTCRHLGTGSVSSKRRPDYLPKTTIVERAALIRVPCGKITRAYGLRRVCDFPIGHPGPHRGSSHA